MSRYAGIVPFAIENGTPALLLGREHFGRDAGKWAAFGGGVNRGEAIMDAAVREGHEETCGLYGDAEALRAQIAIQVALGYSTHYMVPVPYDPDVNTRFQALRGEFLPTTPGGYSPFLEKDEVTWVRRGGLRRLPLRRQFMDDVCALLDAADEFAALTASKK
jgi:8-oxo-dGTP pyrophosphatase MutT (NUDIX family)